MASCGSVNTPCLAGEDGDITANLVWSSDLDGGLGAGGSFSATLSDGTHTITASVDDSGGKSGSDSISITVGTPPPPPDPSGTLSVSVSTEFPSYGNKDDVFITVVVTDGTNNVSGAAVSLVITTGKGKRLTGSSTTDGNGQSELRYRVNSKRDGTGTYRVDVTASKSGFDPGMGDTTFEVN